MIHRGLRRLTATVVGIAAAAAVGGAPALADNDAVYGLTADQRLVWFYEKEPGTLTDLGLVTGLQGSDTGLIGMDFRVQNRRLYAVGNAGGVYVLDTATAQATLVSQLTVALEGTSFGVDFNPAADRLRIVSDTGQNLRHNVNTGGVTLVDTPLNYMAGVAATGVTGAAYTNNDLAASTGTTLFDLDTALDQVVIQSPPNNGSLAATGKLSVNTGSAVGFDVQSKLRRGAAVRNRGFACLTVSGASAFYAVDLLTGTLSFAGVFSQPVVDIALPL